MPNNKEFPFNQDWFHVQPMPPDIWAIREPNHSEDVLCYFIKGRGQNVLIDTGMGLSDLRPIIPDQEVTVLLTHSHWDHMGGASLFPKVLILNHPYETGRLRKGWLSSEMCGFAAKEFAVPVPSDFSEQTFHIQAVSSFETFTDGQQIDLGDKHLSVIHTPGHTPGSVCFYLEEDGFLFSGDTLYPGPEYVYLPESNFADYKHSLARLMAEIGKGLKRIFPGHNEFSADPDLLRRHLLAVNGAIEPEAIVIGQDYFGPYVEKKWSGFSLRLSNRP